MTAQSEQALENGLISTLQDMSYDYVQIKEETNLYSNFKAQLEKHNAKALAEIGRTSFTDKEFEKICIYLEGGTLFEKSKKGFFAKSTGVLSLSCLTGWCGQGRSF